jgi:hypothetical protein
VQAASLHSNGYMPRPVNQTRTGEEVMPTVAYKPNNRLSPEEIEARVWAWVIFVISVILLGSCFSFIYSVTFVTQPMSSMAPIDKVYTKMINDIMLLCTGVLGGVAGRKAVSAAVATATAKAENIDSDNDEPPKP